MDRIMEKQDEYQRAIEEVLTEYAQYKPKYGDVEVQCHFDRERGHYQLMHVGWDGHKRVRGAVIHIDLKGERIWIQHDGTEEGIAGRFVAMSIPKEDIVLGFHAPYKRPYTEFAVG